MLMTAVAGTPEILTAISTVGFPIVMCVIIYIQGSKDSKANREQIGSLTASLNNNTIVINKLLERMEKD